MNVSKVNEALAKEGLKLSAIGEAFVIKTSKG